MNARIANMNKLFCSLSLGFVTPTFPYFGSAYEFPLITWSFWITWF